MKCFHRTRPTKQCKIERENIWSAEKKKNPPDFKKNIDRVDFMVVVLPKTKFALICKT